MTRACLSLLAGVYALQLSSFVPDSDLFAIGLVASLAGLASGRPGIVLLLVTGIAIFLVAALDVINSRIKPQFVGDSIVTRVRIADFPQRHGSNVSLV
ncbi:MAG: hypothetical protein OER22_16450, partial [Gammaproteobacteria bacterium]|nr:hypothetical protein [Gammaproteobacteria bacterium]